MWLKEMLLFPEEKTKRKRNRSKAINENEKRIFASARVFLIFRWSKVEAIHAEVIRVEWVGAVVK